VRELGNSHLEFHPTGVACTLDIRIEPIAEVG